MFTRGFEKVAVSMGWINQRIAGGTAARAGKISGESISKIKGKGAQVGAAIGTGVDVAKKCTRHKRVSKIAAASAPRSRTPYLASHKRTQYRDLSEGGDRAPLWRRGTQQSASKGLIMFIKGLRRLLVTNTWKQQSVLVKRG